MMIKIWSTKQCKIKSDNKSKEFVETLKCLKPFSDLSEPQPTYDWDPNKAWDHTPSWAQPQPEPQRYQVEQHYNVETNNTRSLINKTAPSKPSPSSTKPAPTKPTLSNTQLSAQKSGESLFVSDPLAFAKWDD